MSSWRLSRLLAALAVGSLGAFSAAAELSGQANPSLLTVVLWSSVAVAACDLGAVELVRTRVEDAQVHQQSADEAQRAGVQRLAELRAHFEPRARGVLPFGTLSGWYFCGRVRALSKIVGWLGDLSGDDTRARLVTGGPGQASLRCFVGWWSCHIPSFGLACRRRRLRVLPREPCAPWAPSTALYTHVDAP